MGRLPTANSWPTPDEKQTFGIRPNPKGDTTAPYVATVEYYLYAKWKGGGLTRDRRLPPEVLTPSKFSPGSKANDSSD